MSHNNKSTDTLPLDYLVERLRMYDVTELCDLLGIDSDALIQKFMTVIISKRSYLASELELLTVEDDDEEPEDLSGFSCINPDDGEYI